MSDPGRRPFDRSCFSIDRRFWNPPLSSRKFVHSNHTELGIRPERGQHSRFSDPSYSPLLLTSKTNPVRDVDRDLTLPTVARTLGSELALNLVWATTLRVFSTGYTESCQTRNPPSITSCLCIPPSSSIKSTRAAH